MTGVRLPDAMPASFVNYLDALCPGAWSTVEAPGGCVVLVPAPFHLMAQQLVKGATWTKGLSVQVATPTIDTPNPYSSTISQRMKDASIAGKVESLPGGKVRITVAPAALDHVRKWVADFPPTAGEIEVVVTGHKHAALMALYAADAAENAEPWKLWQVRSGPSGVLTEVQPVWAECDSHPAWHPGTEYRRKPRTIRIGAVDVPEPLRVAPLSGNWIYHATLDGTAAAEQWHSSSAQQQALARGVLHLTSAAAVAHSTALLSLSVPH